MENKPTHLKWRQTIRTHKNLILQGVTKPGALSTEVYHASRSLMYSKYRDAVNMYPLVIDLKQRKTFNKDYPVSVLISIIDSKCGKRYEAGIVIATMLMHGFTTDWDTDPCFNISSASKPLK